MHRADAGLGADIRTERTIERLADAMGFVAGVLVDSGLAPDAQADLLAASFEAVSGVIADARRRGDPPSVHLTADVEPGEVRLAVDDPALDLSTGDLSDSDLRRLAALTFAAEPDPARLRRGADSVVYTYRRGAKNLLELVKYIGLAPGGSAPEVASTAPIR